ncbi:MAG: glycosyltransferase family 2 protein [Vampirovibrio sp.]|nr:glycosyltransferase family 2 protein [Vampirovibrio sp.]
MERLSLLILVLLVWAFIQLMGKILPEVPALVIVMAFMMTHALLLTAALSHKRRKAKKVEKPLNPNYTPKVSVVVPAHNEATVIADTVRHLMKLDYPDMELWIMDDRSTDGTAEILQQLKQHYPTGYNFHVRSNDSFPGKSAVLNDALALTTGDIICVFDADARVDKDFLRQIVPYLEEDVVGAVQARKIISNADENILTRCQNYEYSMDSYFQMGRDAIRSAVQLRGNGQLVKLKALETTHGWNEFTLTDDLDLSTKLHLRGWDIRFASKVHVREEGVTRFKPLLKQRRRWAEGSLVRYLEHAGQIIASNRVSLRAHVDMIAFFAEFLFPLMMLTEYLLLGWDTLTGDLQRTRLFISLLMLPVLSGAFSVNLVIALLKLQKMKWYQAVANAAMTGAYMAVVWIPIVFWVFVKVLFQKQRSMNWGKTEHYGETVQSQA